MIRKLMAIALCVLLALSVVGCSKDASGDGQHDGHDHQTTAPKTYPPMVMINGTLYLDEKIEAKDATIGEAEIEGRIVFTIKSSNKPSRDNEANYVKAHNAPYARWNDPTYGEVYVIQYGGTWYVLRPAETAKN